MLISTTGCMAHAAMALSHAIALFGHVDMLGTILNVVRSVGCTCLRCKVKRNGDSKQMVGTRIL